MLIAGMNALKEAVTFAKSAESKWPESMRMPDGQFVMTYDSGEKAPDNEVLGPVAPRGGHSGIVYRDGKILAEWGDTTRADMTFSVAKSFLALLAGLALGDGRIKSLDDRAGDTALDDGFASEQNRDITWRHLLTQTSEWQGTLFGKEDRIDHNRVVGRVVDPAVAEAPKGTRRHLKKPGTFYEYNDVRVNRLSLSLLQLFKEPLPAVLKRRIMDPIGASAGWRWEGYRNATVKIDGREMVSVPGGGHWGGGIVISARDLALMGLLVAQGGAWDGQRILPKGWTDELVKPCPVAPFYGLMWWLNAGRRQFAAASERSHFALGWGSHIVWIDPDHDLVTVLRWIDRKQASGFVERLLGAIAK
jgi:CubicO group peptidase (beta-lactamase class C family)